MYLQDRADAEASAASLPLWWSLGLGTCGVTLIALTVSAQIYLSMLHHGHSFLRIAAWQLCSWSVWAAATPAVLRLGAQLTRRAASFSSLALRVITMGLVILCAHVVVASVATLSLQPYVPVQIVSPGWCADSSDAVAPGGSAGLWPPLVIGSSIGRLPPGSQPRAARVSPRGRSGACATRRAAARDRAALPVQHAEFDRCIDSIARRRSSAVDAPRFERAAARCG